MQVTKWGDEFLPLERTIEKIVPLTVPCRNHELVTTPSGVAVVNRDNQLLHEQVEPVRNPCEMNDIRNRTNQMGAVTTYNHPRPPCVVGYQP